MNSFIQMIKTCETTSGKGKKTILMDAISKMDDTARKLYFYAMNPYYVFGVKKFNIPKSYSAEDDSPESFFTLLDALMNREVTGNAAKTAIANVLSMYTKETASFLSRVLEKDLKTGFSADTYNKVWVNEQVPTFELMLADKIEEDEDFDNKVQTPCFADFKLDGNRTIVLVDSENITYYSRSGIVAFECEGLFDDELRKIHNWYGQDFALDSERYASNFTETMNAKKEGDSTAKQNLKLHAFFLMPLTDWKDKSTTITMKQNRDTLQEMFNELALKKIVMVQGREVSNYQDMMSFCNQAIDEYKVEGLILKKYDSVYQWERTIDWCKVKRFYDVDFVITGVYPGKPKSRLAKTLGGIYVEGIEESGKRFKCKIGSGFSDELRDEIFNNQSKYIGQVGVASYQEISLKKGAEYYSLRFPTFVRFRDDKIVERFSDEQD